MTSREIDETLGWNVVFGSAREHGGLNALEVLALGEIARQLAILNERELAKMAIGHAVPTDRVADLARFMFDRLNFGNLEPNKVMAARIIDHLENR